MKKGSLNNQDLMQLHLKRGGKRVLMGMTQWVKSLHNHEGLSLGPWHIHKNEAFQYITVIPVRGGRDLEFNGKPV